jgi:photosystem II stability/assembly factor-like uncharacterized protein
MKWLNAILFAFLLFSCQKETISLDMEQIELSTTDDIYDIIFVNDTVAYLCGGKLWKTGVVAKSIDGGETWETVLVADNILFKVAFKNELDGVALGFSGRAWQTTDGGQNWILTENAPNYPVLSDAVFINDNKLIIAAGYNYFFGGFANYSFDNQSFSDSLINEDMESVYFFDDSEGLMAGYGVVYKTYDGGKTWAPVPVNGDYFKDIEFNQARAGLLIGYRGKIFSSTDAGEHWGKTGKKASFFTTKGNLEDAAVIDSKAFICGQNATFYYSNNFVEGEWVDVEHPFNADLFCITLKNNEVGFVTGENGLLIKFLY